MTRASHRSVSRIAWRSGVATGGTRTVPEETPVAFTYGGTTHAVMMATRADFEDFAVGFSLSERIVDSAAEILSMECVEADTGIDVQMVLAENAAAELGSRRRAMAGPVGCGLCGIESIEAAMRQLPRVEAELSLSPSEISRAVGLMAGGQALNTMTRAVHAAGFYIPGGGMVALREDVGRHNALDKLVGCLARNGTDPVTGAFVVTSRLSVEMVQKTAQAGCPFIIAVSAPTALAIDAANDAGVTLVALARGDDFDVYTHESRIAAGARSNVA
jgi:FdhD protein